MKKDGGVYDQFTGATITPRAVVKAVKKALIYFQHNRQTLFADAATTRSGGNRAMTEPTYASITRDGLWTNNPGLVQLLGLCPLLATSNNLINGLGLGLATALALTASNVCVSLIRNVVRPEIRIPVFVLVIAAIVTVIELAMNAYLHELYEVLGIFIPLIVTNCNLIGRAEAFASKHSPGRALVDGLMMGLGFTLVLVALGGLREVVGQGTLFAQAHMMFGEAARGWTLHSGRQLPRLPARHPAARRIHRTGADHRAQERHRRAPAAPRPAHRRGCSRWRRRGNLTLNRQAAKKIKGHGTAKAQDAKKVDATANAFVEESPSAVKSSLGVLAPWRFKNLSWRLGVLAVQKTQ